MTFLRSLLPLCGAALLALAGCASSVPLDQASSRAPVEDAMAAGANANSNANGVGNGNASGVTPVEAGGADTAAASGNLPRVIYFDFDSFVVKDEFRPVVAAHAKRLLANQRLHEVIEGHTDERGGSEYNLALGQKRAAAVVQALSLMGVPADQMEAVSFGKERPAVEGHDESAWAKNRRVELKDR